MKKRWWIVGTVALVVLLAIPLIWLLKDWMRDVVLREILHTAWVVGIRLNSLPQAPLWILFVLIIIYIALRSLFPRTPLPPDPLPPPPPRVGRLRSLARRIERASDGDYYRWDLARNVGTVVVDLLAHHQRSSRSEIRRQLRAGQLDVPPEVQRYLLVGMAPIYTLSYNLFSRFRHLLTPDTDGSSPDGDLEQIVRFLEEQLEISHDPR